MVPAAPRYDSRILDALAALDDPSVSMAETCRHVATVAERLGLPRPSYVHMRRIIHLQRTDADELCERRAAVRRVLLDGGSRVLVGRFVDPYEVAGRLRDITTGTSPK